MWKGKQEEKLFHLNFICCRKKNGNEKGNPTIMMLLVVVGKTGRPGNSPERGYCPIVLPLQTLQACQSGKIGSLNRTL